MVIQKSDSITTLDNLLELKREISLKEDILLNKALQSDDPHAIIKAQNYIQTLDGQFTPNNVNQKGIKSYLYSPDYEFNTGQPFRQSIKSVGYQTLRKMARTPIIKAIIGTRVEQVAEFGEASDNDQEKGWMIRKKKHLWDSNKTSDIGDKKIIERITEFFLNGGDEENRFLFDSFDQVLRASTKDSLELDQVCIELISTRGGQLTQYVPVDAATIRLIDASSHTYQSLPRMYGQLPRYTQVYMDQAYTYFYPWEMTFGVRNKTTDIYSNGYGISELEDLVQIVTYLLYGVQYNGNFFSQGSNPKGFFSISGDVSQSAVKDFKQMWRNTISGVWNSHKVPVVEAGSGKVEWIDMQTTNKDMEFNLWLDFLITVVCCVFKIDPTEVGFNLSKANNVFGQDGQKARLKHSQSKGLVPILRMEQRLFSKYIAERLHPDYEFTFTGIEIEDQVVSLDQDVKKAVNGFVSLEDMFLKYSNRKFNPEKDTLLNSVYQNIKASEQMREQMGGQMMNGVVQEETGEEEKPFEKALRLYLEKPFEQQILERNK